MLLEPRSLRMDGRDTGRRESFGPLVGGHAFAPLRDHGPDG